MQLHCGANLNIRNIAATCALIISLASTANSQVPVVYDIYTNHPSDTIYLGNPAEIILYINAGPHTLAWSTWALTATSTNGLSLDSLVIGGNIIFSEKVIEAFQSGYIWDHWAGVEQPDSIALDAYTLSGSGWTGAGAYATISFEPQDTGTILIDTATIGFDGFFRISSNTGTPQAETLPIDWQAHTIVVAPCPWKVGDLNDDGVITVADILLLVIYVFKGGAPPQPYALMGDADCSRRVSSADIIYLVNYQGKSGPEPCPCFIPPE